MKMEKEDLEVINKGIARIKQEFESKPQNGEDMSYLADALDTLVRLKNGYD
jgi:hypothetical protein